jgi:hypothetical protein
MIAMTAYIIIIIISNGSRLGPSTRCVTAANICKSLDGFNKPNISLEGTFFLGLILLT